MATNFLTVTDLELLASQAVEIILFALLAFGGFLNLYLARKEQEGKRKVIRIAFTIFFWALCVPLFNWIQIESSLLRSGEFTIGTTVGRCQVFGKGKGIEFEYEVDGKHYQNCNTYHPIPIEKIVVAGGKYRVRYSKKFPERGRIDFNQPIQ